MSNKVKKSSSKPPKLWEGGKSDFTEKDFTFVKTPKVDKFQPRNKKQEDCFNLTKRNAISFIIGKVGSGKTTIACHSAIEQLLDNTNEFKKIILLRPVTTSKREQLGFLKGGLDEKIAPLMLPMKNVFIELIGEQAYEKFVEEGKIVEWALAYIEGLTYKNSILILDEFQNIDKETLRGVMTRIDDTSKLFILGDHEQIKLADPENSASHDTKRFENTEGISLTTFLDHEIVRGRITRTVESCYKENTIYLNEEEQAPKAKPRRKINNNQFIAPNVEPDKFDVYTYNKD